VERRTKWSAKWPRCASRSRRCGAVDKEREAISRISEVKKKIEALRFEAEEQTRKGQLDRAAQIQYGELPKLEAELKKLSAAQDGSAAGAHVEGRGR
jgi:ABC-type phosphate transport system auxiliary subunit